MPSVDINWWAVLVAVGVNMVVGAIWYSKALFAKDWSKLTGRKMDQMGDGSTSYVITTAGALVQALILSYVVGWAGATTAIEGAFVGLLLWLAFVAVPQGVNTVFAGGRKKLWAINTGYFLAVLVINGAILAAWR
jgi:hypothetical protein